MRTIHAHMRALLPGNRRKTKMFQSINKSQFRDAFHSAGRANQFSYDALGLLFDYIEDVSPDDELDVIAICCEYSENTTKDAASDYDLDIDGLDDATALAFVADYLCENTTVIGTTDAGAIVYAQF